MNYELSLKAVSLAFEHVKRQTPLNDAFAAVGRLVLPLLPPAVAKGCKTVDLDASLAELKEQMLAVLDTEPPEVTINGFWFGIVELLTSADADDAECVLYVAGSERFDPENPDPDWPVGPEWWPEGRYFELPALVDLNQLGSARGMSEDARWLVNAGLIEPAAILLVGSLCQSTEPARLLAGMGGVAAFRGIACGFDEGEQRLLGVVTPKGFSPVEELQLESEEVEEEESAEDEFEDDDFDDDDDDDLDGDEEEDDDDDDDE